MWDRGAGCSLGYEGMRVGYNLSCVAALCCGFVLQLCVAALCCGFCAVIMMAMLQSRKPYQDNLAARSEIAESVSD